jgi:hypothetical protein
MHRAARLLVLFASLALPLLSAGAATASVTLGQVAPTSANCSAPATDLIQPTVTSGASYVAPGDGTITSWKTRGGTSAGTARLKVFRKVGEPNRYRVVAADSSRNLTASVENSFNVTLGGIQAGDVIGLTFQTNTGCQFAVPGESFLSRTGDLSTGQEGDFTGAPGSGFRTDVSATFDPSHKFTLGGVTRNKKRGTATLAGTFPGPGSVTLTGKGLKGAGTPIQVPAKGDIAMAIKAAGSKRHTLFDTGKVTLNVSAVYTPTSGSAGTAATKVKLKKKL